MALIKHGNNALSNITSLPSAIPTGKPVLLSTATASASASVSFTSNIDSTYDIYKFEFINIHAASNNVRFQFQGSTNGGSSYGITITSSAFAAEHNENDAAAALAYNVNSDLAQSTSYQHITAASTLGNVNDDSLSGFLFLFSPSSTTYVKHFICRAGFNDSSTRSMDSYVAGYFNSTSAINAINFQCSSGNIDAGTIKMYGISA